MNSEALKDSPLTYGGAINQSRRRIESEIKRVQKKMEAGAEFFLTQPVFTAEDAERLRRVKEERVQEFCAELCRWSAAKMLFL